MNWVGTHAYTSCSITAPVNNVKRIINARASMSSTSNGFINWSQIANINIGSENSTSWSVACLEDYYLRGLTIQYIKTTD